jgi:hypothetical protein
MLDAKPTRRFSYSVRLVRQSRKLERCFADGRSPSQRRRRSNAVAAPSWERSSDHEGKYGLVLNLAPTAFSSLITI